MTTPSKIGVTGGAGFIGSHLCERLLAEGRQVIAVDDLSHGTTANMAGFVQHPNFRFHQMDCRNPRELRRVFAGCDAIAHLAAEKIPRYGGALQTLESNVAGAHAACEVALSLGALVIVTSTSDVYGNATPPFAEDDHVVIGPSTTRRWAYAVSKLYDEHIALAMAEEKGLRTVILRLFNVYGPRNHPTWWGGPVTAFTEALLDGEIMDLHGDGRQVRTFTYVSDTVDGFVRALDTPDAVGRDPEHRRRRADHHDPAGHRRPGGPRDRGAAAGEAAALREDRRPLPGRPLPDPGHREGGTHPRASTRAWGSPRAWPAASPGTWSAAG